MVWDQVDCQGTIGVFEVKKENSERVRIVRFDHLNSNISCSCKKFESLGILCCHALWVFSIKNLTRIPSQYILKRWTKETKKGMMTYEQDNHSLSNDKEAKIVWCNSMMQIANTIISKSQGEDSLKRICQKLLLELDEKNWKWAIKGQVWCKCKCGREWSHTMWHHWWNALLAK